MAMWTVIAKNSSGSDQTIEDLGITIADSSQYTLSENFTFDALAGSDDLRALVTAGDLVINDGSSDLSAADGVDYLTLSQAKDIADNHYTKTEMQTSGQASLHWDNVTNAPSFGAVAWKEPVLYRVLAIQAAEPTPTGVGDVYVDTDDDHYYKYNVATWDDLGAIGSGDRVIKLDEADEAIFEYSGSSWDDSGAPADNDAVCVDDDGDGKAAQYVYDLTATEWKKIGDVDFSGHMDGGANKHDASEIDVEGTYTHIATGDLENAIEDIDDELISLNSAVGAISTNTLDEAYDEGGAGNGRTISADSGAVKIDTGAATNAPLELTEKSSLPSTGLAAGQLAVKDGILCVYDGTRSKWLSVQRIQLPFGTAKQVMDQYLAFGAGSLPSNNSGYRMLRDATIVGISGQLDASGTCDMHVRKNDVATNIATLSLSSVVGNQSTSLNIDVSQGDYLQAFLESAAKVEDPMMVVEIAWRP